MKPEEIITEDSNSGFEFFKAVGKENGINCESAGGKSNIFHMLEQTEEKKICVIADGAAIGPEVDRLYQYASRRDNIYLYFPESFEWLILSSGLIEGKELQDILETPETYIDSRTYFSWERFFSHLLTEKTRNTYGNNCVKGLFFHFKQFPQRLQKKIYRLGKHLIFFPDDESPRFQPG